MPRIEHRKPVEGRSVPSAPRAHEPAAAKGPQMARPVTAVSTGDVRGPSAARASASVVPGGAFEKPKPGGRESFTQVGVGADVEDRYLSVSADLDVVSINTTAPTVWVTVGDDIVQLDLVRGETAGETAARLAQLIKKEGFSVRLEEHPRSKAVDLVVTRKDKAGHHRAVEVDPRNTSAMPGLKIAKNVITVPKEKPEPLAPIMLELGAHKVEIARDPDATPKQLAAKVAAAARDAGHLASVKVDDDGSAEVKIAAKDALHVEVFPVQREIDKLFGKVVESAEVQGDGAAAYALHVDPKALRALEKGDPTALKLFLLKAVHGSESFAYEAGDGSDVSGADVIKGRDVAIVDTDPRYAKLRAKDGFNWKILEKNDVFPHGLRYIFEDDDADFAKALAKNENGEREQRAKLETALHAFEGRFLDFPATSFHLIRIPDNGVGSAYAVLALDSKNGVVRVAGNYFEPGGPPPGAFG